VVQYVFHVLSSSIGPLFSKQMIFNASGILIFSHKLIRSNPNYRTTTTLTIHHTPHLPPNPTSFQKCPKEDQDATTTTAPNATVADADGSTHPSVTVQLTSTSVQPTTCLTRHTRLAVCVMVRTMLLRELGEINRLVTRMNPLMSVKVRKEMGRRKKARKVKAKKVEARKVMARRGSDQPRLLLTFLAKHDCLTFLTNSISYTTQLLKHHIQEIEYPPFHENMDAMVPGHFFPGYPPNMSQGSLESVNEAFTSTLFLVAGVLVLLFWRVPAV
jgi:hypothetical protein